MNPDESFVSDRHEMLHLMHYVPQARAFQCSAVHPTAGCPGSPVFSELLKPLRVALEYFQTFLVSKS